jgi:hypothetical protein
LEKRGKKVKLVTDEVNEKTPEKKVEKTPVKE